MCIGVQSGSDATNKHGGTGEYFDWDGRRCSSGCCLPGRVDHHQHLRTKYKCMRAITHANAVDVSLPAVHAPLGRFVCRQHGSTWARVRGQVVWISRVQRVSRVLRYVGDLCGPRSCAVCGWLVCMWVSCGSQVLCGVEQGSSLAQG